MQSKNTRSVILIRHFKRIMIKVIKPHGLGFKQTTNNNASVHKTNADDNKPQLSLQQQRPSNTLNGDRLKLTKNLGLT